MKQGEARRHASGQSPHHQTPPHRMFTVVTRTIFYPPLAPIVPVCRSSVCAKLTEQIKELRDARFQPQRPARRLEGIAQRVHGDEQGLGTKIERNQLPRWCERLSNSRRVETKRSWCVRRRGHLES